MAKTNIAINSKNAMERLDAVINCVQANTRSRKINGFCAISALYNAYNKIGISKRALNGCKIEIDLHAESMTGYENYHRMSTHIAAIHHAGHWTITDVFRAPVARKTRMYHFTLTDDARQAIVQNAINFRR